MAVTEPLKPEKSYVMIKPDGVQRGLVGRIIQRFEDKGMTLLGLKMILASEDTLEEHYSELKERPFFGALMAYVRAAIQQNSWHDLEKPFAKGKTSPRLIPDLIISAKLSISLLQGI